MRIIGRMEYRTALHATDSMLAPVSADALVIAYAV